MIRQNFRNVIILSGISMGSVPAPAQYDQPFATPTARIEAIEKSMTQGNVLPEMGINYHKQLLSWFETGTEVSFEEVKGGWSGRCFGNSPNSNPYNSIIVGLETNDVGPAFPPRQYLIKEYQENEKSDYFDNYNPISDYDRIKQRLLDFIDNYKIQQTSKIDGTLTWTTGRTSDDLPTSLNSVRRHNDFLIFRRENLVLNKNDKKNTSTFKKETWEACYYFKNLSQ